MAALGGPGRRVHRQRVLISRHILLIHRQPPALLLIADQHRRAIGSLHAQQIVEISFVGREDHVELRIFEIQPGQIALVVIVGQQRIGAQAQKVCERGVIAEAAASRSAWAMGTELGLILLLIGTPIRRSSVRVSRRCRVVDRRLVFGMLLDVLLDAGARQVMRIQLMPGRHGGAPANGRFSSTDPSARP